MNWSEFWNMGGYAFYVWTSYGLALLVLAANVIAPVRQRRRLLHELTQKEKRMRNAE